MGKHQIDAIDRRILDALQGNGRMTIQDLAEKVGLTTSPCLRRVRALEDQGVIRGYVAIIDQVAVSLPISVFASVKLERQREEELDRFAAAVARWPEVLECYLMTGHRDYLLRIVVADLAAYELFLKQKLTRLEGVSSIESGSMQTTPRQTTPRQTFPIRERLPSRRPPPSAQTAIPLRLPGVVSTTASRWLKAEPPNVVQGPTQRNRQPIAANTSRRS